MVLRRNVASHVFHPLIFSLYALTLGRQDSFAEALCEHRSRSDFVHPFDTLCENFGVNWMLEIARVDGRWLERVGTGDIDAATGQWML